MRILALKPGHDGHIALLEDGKLMFSIEAEKDSWPRYETVTPDSLARAMELCADVPDVLALSGWVKGFHSISAPTLGGYFGWSEDCAMIEHRRLFGRDAQLFASSHERSHIFCSYGLSPFPEGLPFYALVWEGNIGAFYRVDEYFKINRIGQVLEDPGNKYAFLYALADPKFPDGLRHFRFEDAGKLMALSSYGEPGDPDPEEQRIIERVLSQRSILITLNKAELRDSPFYNIGVESSAFKRLARRHSDAIFARFHSFAQANLREGLPLAISGGCGLNCDWNSDWHKSGLFADIFVPPCTNDSGSAIGTAIEAQHALTGSAKINWSVYAGEEFVIDCAASGDAAVAPLDLDQLAAELAAGKVYAWVQGKYEIGPRALGNRSLIAMPFTRAMHARLNAIKEREGFRPIAPICLEEEMDRLFEHHGPSPHMLYFQKHRTTALPAVTHVDGSARAQSVTANQNPRMHALLTRFKARTGYGILCNTSLNFKGTGFINRLSDLHRYASERGLDGYVIGDRVFTLKTDAKPRQLADVA